MAKKETQCCETKFKTSCGGQALIEGIMMQGPDRRAVVVRKPDGELDITTWDMKPRKKVWKLPFLRGLITFGSAMLHGVKALMYSAEFYPDDENAKPGKLDLWLEKHFSDKKLESLIITLAVVLGVGLSVFLFMVLPTFLTSGILHFFPGFPLWGRNVVEGILKVCIFILYLAVCSRQSDIYRVFQYHGAEHKSIFCYEAGLPLTVETVRKQPKHHPRCGTSFLFVVIFVSIIVSSIVFGIWPMTNAFMRTGVHLLLLPLVVGITYEFNRWVGRHVGESGLAKILTAPGMWLQNFTTFEPDDSMIEVAIEALRLVLPREQGADAW